MGKGLQQQDEAQYADSFPLLAQSSQEDWSRARECRNYGIRVVIYLCTFFPSLAFCNLKRDSLRLGRDYLRCPWRRFSFCVLFVGVPLDQIFSQRPHSSCMVTRKSCFVLSFNRPRGMFSTPRLWTILEALEGFSDC